MWNVKATNGKWNCKFKFRNLNFEADRFRHTTFKSDEQKTNLCEHLNTTYKFKSNSKLKIKFEKRRITDFKQTKSTDIDKTVTWQQFIRNCIFRLVNLLNLFFNTRPNTQLFFARAYFDLNKIIN